ncbi:sperm-tail PG-rich repeat-containing protein 2-like [Ischnura elegans]|uniref:sperm-tail PG-rich repeat-containing protein 2-like n=1 Tax=Ischnura elegans TaxID=197161 RepID=UPI001ED8684A|nr:sperm-tail PG-rich repeat-containing protein 2-like [Ischnura elegans]
MYSFGKRFDAFQCNTPTNVGPGSYNISGLVKSSAYGRAPFQSMKPRDLSLSNADANLIPAPTEYCPRAQSRIPGGTSMQNRAPRFTYRPKSGPGPCDYPSYLEDEERSNAPSSPHSGRLVRATIRYNTSPAASSMPGAPASIKGFEEYQEMSEMRRNRKIYPQMGNCSPCVLHGSLNLGRYRGVNFGKMTARKGMIEENDEPGPGDYDVDSAELYVPIPYTNKKWWKLQNGKHMPRNPCSTVKCGGGDQTPGIILNPYDPTLVETARRNPCSFVADTDQPNSQRYLDVLLEKTLRENFPAPNAYHVIKNVSDPLQLAEKKRGRREEKMDSEGEWKEQFLEGIRRKLNIKRRSVKPFVVQPFISSVPRFAETSEKRPGPAEYTICRRSFVAETMRCPSGVAFAQRAARFPKVKSSPTPGPGNYNVQGMTDELLRRIRPNYCWLKGDYKRKAAFGSSASRVTSLVPPGIQELPGPSDYDTRIRQCSWKYRTRVCTRKPRVLYVRSTVEVEMSQNPVKSGERPAAARPAGCRVTFCPRASKWRLMGRRRRPRRERLPNPFKATKQAPEVTPGPALYYPEVALHNAVLRRSYCVRLDSRCSRFPDDEDDTPVPGQYQVDSSMLKKSFNVRFTCLALRDPIAWPKGSRPRRKRTPCSEMPEGTSTPKHCTLCLRCQAPVEASSALAEWRGKRFGVARGPDEKY